MLQLIFRHLINENNIVATGTVKSFLPLKQESEPVQRSRSSSQIQNVVLHRRNNDCNNDGNISAGTIQNKFIRKRIRHIKKSPDLFGCNDTDSPAFASNVSMVKNGSEMVTINSDACSLNLGSAKHSGLKLEQSEIISGSKYEAELDKVLDCEMKVVIDRKKSRQESISKTREEVEADYKAASFTIDAKDRAMQLQISFNKLKRDEISKDHFV